ncbi:MAG: peptidylprolyl isomerase [Candidatus Latescibacteria bacterium]|nr:peptidylprolyl isomerase [Candidatus Latescibacterota bacterium]
MLISYSHGKIYPEEIVKYLGLTGRSYMIIAEIIKNKVTVEKAGDFGLVASDEELQKYADNFRSLLNLYSTNDMYRFLENSGLTVDDFEAFCETAILVGHLKNYLSGEEKIKGYFVNNRADFDLVRISSITVKEENLAKDLIMQVEEDGEDFHVLARKYSTDDTTRYTGGYIGLVSRKIFPPEITAKLFNASEGELIGPFQRDDEYQLLLVEEVLKAELNENVKNEIKDIIFNEWVSSFLKNGIKITEN